MVLSFIDGTPDETKFQASLEEVAAEPGGVRLSGGFLVAPNFGRTNPEAFDITTDQASGFTAANAYSTRLDQLAQDLGATAIIAPPPRALATNTIANVVGWAGVNNALKYTISPTEYFVNAAGDEIIDATAAMAGAAAALPYYSSTLIKSIRSAFGTLFKPLAHRPFSATDPASLLEAANLIPIGSDPQFGQVMLGDKLVAPNDELTDETIPYMQVYQTVQHFRYEIRKILRGYLGREIQAAASGGTRAVRDLLEAATGVSLRAGSSFEPDNARNTQESLAMYQFHYQLVLTPIRTAHRFIINESVTL